MNRAKPMSWNFHAGLVAPGWKWFHGQRHTPMMIAPLFTPTPNTVRGVRDYSSLGGDEGLPALGGFEARPAGLAYFHGPDTAASRIITWSNREFASGILPVTMMWHGFLDSTANGQTFMSKWSKMIIRTDSGGYQIILNAFDTNDRVGGGTTVLGEQVIIGRFDGILMSIWKDGVKLAEITPTGSWDTDSSQLLSIGGQPAAGTQQVLGASYQAGLWGGAWTDGEICQFSRDPYGPWPPDLRIVGKAAAVAGLSIPVAMHSYRRRRVA